MTEDICTNISLIQERIADTCTKANRRPEQVTLVAVSKLKPLQDIRTAFGCGQLHFGENRAKELQGKMEEFDEPQIRWHMIGRLQSNKIKYMIDRVDWIDSVPKKKILREIEKRASRVGRTINVLIQANISGEPQKGGCEPKDLGSVLEYASSLNHVRVRGLMGMASYVAPEDAEEVRPQFRLLRKLREEHTSYEGGNIELKELSMGMTNDLEVAIEEGSTMIRVGRAIFGERDYT